MWQSCADVQGKPAFKIDNTFCETPADTSLQLLWLQDGWGDLPRQGLQQAQLENDFPILSYFLLF